jgi:DNA-binding transcriptional LysR family regulator
VTELIAHTWLRRYLLTVHDRYPNVTVELTVGLSETLSGLLFDRDLDLALQNGPFVRASTGTVTLQRSPQVWVAAPGLPGTSGRLTPQDLSRFPIFTHARGTRPWRQLTAHFREAGVAVRLVPSSNIAVCLQMTLDRLGIASLPVPMVESALADGRLVELDYPWRQDDLVFEARYDADTAPS